MLRGTLAAVGPFGYGKGDEASDTSLAAGYRNDTPSKLTSGAAWAAARAPAAEVGLSG